MNHFLTKFAPGLIVATLLVSCWYSVHLLLTQSPSTDTQEAINTSQTDSDIVTLPAGKLTAANLETSSVQSSVLSLENVITGRIQYDERKHVDIKAPLDGLLQEIVVTPGEQVERGDLIAIMRSPEIGQARSEVIKRKRELDLATQILSRESTIAENLNKLLAKITPPAVTATSELNLDESALGTYRQEILTAHAKLQLAQELLNNIQPLAETGAVPVARSERDKPNFKLLAPLFKRHAIKLSITQHNRNWHRKQKLLKPNANSIWLNNR